MSVRVRGKRQLVVETLAERIARGAFRPGERLDGEHRLAEEFAVSRGTIRQALGELQRRNLISTQSGLGSFVTFDGHALDQRLGWAHALAQTGVEVTTTVLGIEPVAATAVPGLPASAGAGTDQLIAVRRVRTTPAGDAPARVLSFECASVPAVGTLRDLPTSGLRDGSLSASLRAEGLVAGRGEQSVDVRELDAREAGITGRPVGTPFLRSVRTSFDAQGRFVEHVVSLLDPAHFRLQLAFGAQA